MTSEHRCGACGARNGPGATWCSLCHARLPEPPGPERSAPDPEALLAGLPGSEPEPSEPTATASRQDPWPASPREATSSPGSAIPTSEQAFEQVRNEWLCSACGRRNLVSAQRCEGCGVHATGMMAIQAGLERDRSGVRNADTGLPHPGVPGAIGVGRAPAGGFLGWIASSFASGLQLALLSFRLATRHPQLMLVPAVTVVVSALLALSIAAIAGVEVLALLDPASWEHLDLAERVAYLILFVVSYLLAILAQAVLVVAFTDRFDGRPVDLSRAVRQVVRHLGPLARWALVDAAVGFVLDMVSERVNRTVGFAGKLAWHTLTVLVVPMIAVEGIPVREAIRRSRWLIGRVWSRSLVSGFGLGLLVTVLAFVTVLTTVLIATVQPLIGLVLLLVGLVAIQLLAAVAGSALAASLYRYALTGEVPSPFTPRVLRVPGHMQSA
ncbi:hypothetical protein ER308_14315 [Egibacter rhizosphaerae]|uniref:RanBP2-type domain-containing protein n=1 Tax=Egibacter rhizosphaerae TaxID=1670831 RepID=A0A411YH79_9ACTN|nr:DUF6159 family protein [Egibacter rhizosphaerae]QBI20618.1 hypothetical protein ER308_14315 [Egibacter rhizosphaerae]